MTVDLPRDHVFRLGTRLRPKTSPRRASRTTRRHIVRVKPETSSLKPRFSCAISY